MSEALLSRIRQLIPPPAAPVGTGTPDKWQSVEQALGTTLPLDYKQFIDTYGTGWFAGYIALISPFYEEWPLLEFKDEILNLYEWRKEEFPEGRPPFPTYPEPGGLLPWGVDENGGAFFWRTTGHPEEWTTVVLNADYDDVYDEYPTSLTSFLTGLLEGTIVVSRFPPDLDLQSFRQFES